MSLEVPRHFCDLLIMANATIIKSRECIIYVSHVSKKKMSVFYHLTAMVVSKIRMIGFHIGSSELNKFCLLVRISSKIHPLLLGNCKVRKYLLASLNGY